MVSIVDTLSNARVVPVIRHDDRTIALEACRLLAEAGIRAIEITTTVPSAPQLIADLRRGFPDLCVGAGTVTSAEQADRVLDAGAEFVVSPCWSDAAACKVLGAGVPYLPGAMTPGEVLHHADNGATLVKIFPADTSGGPRFLKALRAVFPKTLLMPTGGITPETAQDYLNAGAVCVGIGGNLVPVNALEAGDADLARQQIRTALSTFSFQTS